MHLFNHRRFSAAAALFLSIPALAQTPPAAPAAERAWDVGDGDVPRDPTILYGVLPNGMKYAIRQNATPKGSAVIRFRIDVGSTGEAEDQRGLAHFIEHMAFNGSTNVREGEMVKMLERDGLSFGADTNASTSYTETIYKLDLPRTDEKLIDTGLMLMRETASELSFSPAAVERERGVILSELRLRDQFAQRSFDHLLGLIAPGSPAARRNVIGTKEVLQTAPVGRLRDLYDRFYTPSRATLIIVGDFDANAIEAKIKARFSDWKAKGNADGDPAAATIDPKRASEAAYFVDPAIPTQISIIAVKPFERKRDTPALRQQQTLERIAMGALGRRLARLAQSPDAPILGGSASAFDNFIRTAQLAAVDIAAKDDDWRPALRTGEQELRRALLYGFTQAEIAEQVAIQQTSFENAAASSATRSSASIADAVASAVEQRAVTTTPEWRRDSFRAMLPVITVDAVNAAFRARWAGANPLVRVAAKTPLDRAPEAILNTFAESAKIAVTPPVVQAQAAFAYTDFGAAGKVVADARIADLGLRTIRFANNVRLTIKKTDFERDIVRMSLRVGGGGLEFGKDKPGLDLFMTSVFGAGGLQKHSLDELRTILAGKSVTPGFGAENDNFGIKLATTPRDFELQTQLITAYLTAPGFRPEGDQFWQRVVPVFLPTLDASPDAVLQRDEGRILADNDPRFGIPDAAALKARTMAELRTATAQAFARGSIEIGIVGDIDEAKAIDIVARTFGALALRDADPLPFAEARKVHFPRDPAPVTLRHSGKASEAQIVRYWPTTDDSDAKNDVALDMLANVMQIMLTDEVREKLGATYGPSARSNTSSIFPGYGYLSAGSNVDPARLGEVDAAIDRLVARLRAAPVSVDILARARNPLIERLTKRLRENWWWLSIVEKAQTEPRFVARARTDPALYAGVTPAQLMAVARRYLVPAKALTIRVLPKAAP